MNTGRRLENTRKPTTPATDNGGIRLRFFNWVATLGEPGCEELPQNTPSNPPPPVNMGQQNIIAAKTTQKKNNKKIDENKNSKKYRYIIKII